MTVLSDLLPAADAPDDDEIHVVCCNPDTALCGADVSGADWTLRWVTPDEVTCRTCLDLAGGRCGARCCRLRALCRAVYDRIRAGAR